MGLDWLWPGSVNEQYRKIIIYGGKYWNEAIIPRKIFMQNKKSMPFCLPTKQLPLTISFAMTIIKKSGTNVRSSWSILNKTTFYAW